MYGPDDYPGTPAMNIHYRWALVAAAIVLSIVPSHAGPCSSEIERLQAGVDAIVVAMAVSGSPGRQSVAAMVHRQPTPSSIAAAEAKLGEGERTKRALAAIARASEADRAGDNPACERALADARREMGP